MLRHGDGVFAEHGGARHVALLQAHAATVLQIDCRDDQHALLRESLKG
jgi:hypothetical protein